MKINYKRFKCLLLLFVIIGLTNCEQTNSTATTHKKEEIKKLELVNKSDGYVIPQTVKHYDDTVMSDKTIILPLGQSMRTSHPILSSPMMRHQITTTTSYMPSHVRVPTCPCAGEVRCKPCNGIVEPNADIYNTPISSCPCAPPISCPRCPPVSLIHEIASKKDQNLAYNLKTHSEKITKYFDMIIKYSNDVVNSENDAVKAAKQMEEATLKALFARKNMVNISEKARLVAKTSIVENRPCVGMNCPIISPENMGFYDDKIFPNEVENIKDYMDDTFTTNLNGGYGSDYNSLDSIENEADGKINLHKIRYNNGGNRGRGFQQNRSRGGWNTSVDYTNSNNMMGMNTINPNMNMNGNRNTYFNQQQNLNGQQSGAVPNNYNPNMQNIPNQIGQAPNGNMTPQMNRDGNSMLMNPQQGVKPNLR